MEYDDWMDICTQTPLNASVDLVDLFYETYSSTEFCEDVNMFTVWKMFFILFCYATILILFCSYVYLSFDALLKRSFSAISVRSFWLTYLMDIFLLWSLSMPVKNLSTLAASIVIRSLMVILSVMMVISHFSTKNQFYMLWRYKKLLGLTFLYIILFSCYYLYVWSTVASNANSAENLQLHRTILLASFFRISITCFVKVFLFVKEILIECRFEKDSFYCINCPNLEFSTFSNLICKSQTTNESITSTVLSMTAENSTDLGDLGSQVQINPKKNSFMEIKSEKLENLYSYQSVIDVANDSINKETSPIVIHAQPPVNTDYLIGNIEAEMFDERGGVFHSYKHGVTVIVPTGAIPRGLVAELKFAATLISPLPFQENKTPVSAIYWLCMEHKVQLQKPITLQLPLIKLENSTDALQFAKITHSTQLNATDFQMQNLDNGEFTDGECYGSLQIDHFCYYCIMYNNLECKDIPPNKYLLIAMKQSQPSLEDKCWSIDICLVTDLRTCVGHLIDQYDRDWEYKELAEFSFEDNCDELEIQLASYEFGNAARVDTLSVMKIKKEDVDFHQYYSNDKLKELKYRMDQKQYPPRCKARVVAKHKRFFAKASRKIKVQCTCNTKLSYKGTISIPCSSSNDVYGENSSESDSDSSVQQDVLSRSSATSATVKGAVVIDQIADKNERPSMKDLNRHVTKKFATDWYDIGIELGLDLDVLDIIEKDRPQKSVDCFQKTLDKWLKLNTDDATWKALEVALNNVNRAKLGLNPVDDVYVTVMDTSECAANGNQSSVQGYRIYGDNVPLDDEDKLEPGKLLNQDVIKWMLEARADGSTIKVRYGKVLFSGSSAVGKTSFFYLLMKKKFDQQYRSTGLADSCRVTTKVYVHSSSTDKSIEFKELDFDSEISQLRSHINKKVNNAPIHENPTSTISSETKNNEQITEIETNIAAKLDNTVKSEIDQTPKQSSEKVWDILTFIDTGGQPEYISILPAVNSCVMVTFVIHKMEGGVKTLDNPVTIVHNGKHFIEPYSLGYTNLDLIKTLMSFTNNTLLRKKPFLDEICCKTEHSNSYLSLIGTHLDKILEKDINEIDKVLARTVVISELKHVLTQIYPNLEHLIPVDNTTAGQTNEDSSAAKIRKKIYDLLQEQEIYDVPYIWLLLELEIRNVCKNRGCTFITYTEVLELCKQKNLSDNEEFIKNGLIFHHLFGVLLYFDEVPEMKDFIITDHKWLFNKLTEIVCLHSADFNNTDIYYDLKHKGTFNKTLLDKIDLIKEFEESGIVIEKCDIKNAFLNLLQHLKIIAPLNNSTKYFMPCLLSSCNLAEDLQRILQDYGTNCIAVDDHYPDQSVEPLLIQFTACSSSHHIGSFPRGVYCCLVVQLLQDNPEWMQLWSTNTEKKLFNNLVTFFMESKDHGHYITLIDRLFFLEVHVTHDKTIDYKSAVHHHVFCIINDALYKVGVDLNFCNFELSHGFFCHKCKSTEVHMTKLRKKTAKYSYCYCNQSTKMTLSHRIWFEDALIITTTKDTTKGIVHTADICAVPEDIILSKISKLINKDWFDIGLQLNVKTYELECIDSYSKEVENKAFKTLLKWKRGNSHPCYCELLSALSEQDLHGVVEHMKQLLLNKKKH